jgi:hypothetical protein
MLCRCVKILISRFEICKRYCYLHKHKNKLATTQTSTNDYVLGQIMTYPQEHNVIGNY